MLQIRLLGRFDVQHDGEPVEIPSRPAQSLLAFLALSPGVSHRRERLSGLLWPDADEANARSNLRHALWRVRQGLSTGSGKGDGFLTSDNLSLTFTITPEVWVDAQQVARKDLPEETPKALLEDVSAYGGELLPGFYDEWVILERERLRASFERKMQALLACLVTDRRWPEVLDWGERWVALGQAPEPAFRALMEASAALGDRAGVAAAYRRCQEALQRDLGVEPSAQTVETFHRLATVRPAHPKTAESPAAAAAVSHSQAVEVLFDRWHQAGVAVLDVAALATVYAAPPELALRGEDLRLCLWSAVQHGLELQPWIQRASRADVVAALEACYRQYPKPGGRAAIVEALADIGGPEADGPLQAVVQSEDSPSIRALAALALARGGRLREAVSTLLAALSSTNEPAALAALVAVADEVGLPADVGPIPRGSVGLGVAQRRWRASRGRILAQATRAAVGGALALAVHGAGTPAYMALGRPEVFATAQDFITIPGWVISAAVTGLVVGALQGTALGAAVGIADAMGHGPKRPVWRLAAGALAGLVQPAFLIPFSLAGLLEPVAGPQVYVPVNILYGLILGALIAMGMPRLGDRPPWRAHLVRPLLSAAVLAAATVPYVLLIYRELAGASMLSRLLFAAILAIGVGMSQCRWRPAPDSRG
jgi:DNA-binding SARP family transcriptional activator